MSDSIVFEDVSKFYGDVLGVNRVDLVIPQGITGLVGPNGSGKSTLMNLVTGLLRPSRGRISVLGIPTDDPERLFSKVGYSTQVDSFPKGMSALGFVRSYLRLHGYSDAEADDRARRSLARFGLTDAIDRRVAGFSKGMRQRARLALALAHDPQVLVLDEPLNGLDPMARAEVMAVFQELAHEDRHILISSHILHEVDMIADQVVLLSAGYVIAEGDVTGVRSEVKTRPIQVLLRCDRVRTLAARLMEEDHVVEVTLHDDEGGLLVRTRDADRFWGRLQELIVELEIEVETQTVADGDVRAVYTYLVGSQGTESL